MDEQRERRHSTEGEGCRVTRPGYRGVIEAMGTRQASPRAVVARPGEHARTRGGSSGAEPQLQAAPLCVCVDRFHSFPFGVLCLGE